MEIGLGGKVRRGENVEGEFRSYRQPRTRLDSSGHVVTHVLLCGKRIRNIHTSFRC